LFSTPDQVAGAGTAAAIMLAGWTAYLHSERAAIEKAIAINDVEIKDLKDKALSKLDGQVRFIELNYSRKEDQAAMRAELKSDLKDLANSLKQDIENLGERLGHSISKLRDKEI